MDSGADKRVSFAWIYVERDNVIAFLGQAALKNVSWRKSQSAFKAVKSPCQRLHVNPVDQIMLI